MMSAVRNVSRAGKLEAGQMTFNTGEILFVFGNHGCAHSKRRCRYKNVINGT